MYFIQNLKLTANYEISFLVKKNKHNFYRQKHTRAFSDKKSFLHFHTYINKFYVIKVERETYKISKQIKQYKPCQHLFNAHFYKYSFKNIKRTNK